MSKVLQFEDTYVPVSKISACNISKDLSFDIGSKIKYTLSIKTDSGTTYNVITGVEDKSMLEKFILDKVYGDGDGVLTYDETALTIEESNIREKKIKEDKEESKKPDEFKKEIVEESKEDEIQMVEVEKKENLTKKKKAEILESVTKRKKKGE